MTNLILSPVAALDKLFSLDKRVYLVVISGLAVMAAAVIVSTWDIGVTTLALVSLYVIGLGVVLIAVANVPGWFQQAIASLIVFTLSAVVAAFIISSVFRPHWLAPPWCLAQFWVPCEIVEREVRQNHGAALDARLVLPDEIKAPKSATVVSPETIREPLGVTPQPMASPTSAPTPIASPTSGAGPKLPGPQTVSIPVPRSQIVYVQYGGLIPSETITRLSAALRKGGWRVPGKGEALGAASGLNEVRYSAESDREAAVALAAAITDTGITSAPVKVVRVRIVNAGTLELWISN